MVIFNGLTKSIKANLTYVEALMDFKSACARVLLVAVGELADEWLEASVRHLMRLQMAPCNKLLLALLALKGPFASVGSHVSF